MRSIRVASAALGIASIAIAWAATSARAEEGATVTVLQIALQREVTAERRDIAYAARATQEGFAPAATLFCALATAERVHADHFRRSLEALGVTPVERPEPFVLRSTPENLRASIDAEVLERGAAYPRFMRYARAECLYDALAAMRYARSAEASHAAQLAAVLADLGPGAPPYQCVVCPGCGVIRSFVASASCGCGGATANGLAFGPTPAAPKPVPALAAR